MKKGFTLVELMIVVAIIGILAAIAIPNFVEMQYRAKRAEAPEVVTGIKTAQVAYDAAFDTYETAAITPRAGAACDKEQVAWTTNPNWNNLGYEPDGQVRGGYQTTDNNTDFTVTGVIDVDNDNVVATYTADKNSRATLGTAADIY